MNCAPVREETAAYFCGSKLIRALLSLRIGKDVKNAHFRPYDVPAKIWFERYAEEYDEVISERGR